MALAITIFTATSSILSELQSAPAAFAGSGDYVIHSSDAPTIFSSQVDVGIVPLLLSQENITDAWAEIVTFSAWSDKSFVVRGMDIDSALSDGRLPVVQPLLAGAQLERTSALAGSRLMDRLDITPPCIIPLSGSYASRVEFAHVVGWFEAGSYLDDELIVSEDVARYLCNMPSDTASQIAVATDDPTWLEEVLSPDDARFALFDVRASRTAVVPGEEVTITMEVRNWGAAAGEASLRIADDGAMIDELTLSLDASASTTVQSRLSFESMGVHPLEIWISGDLLSSAALNISVVDPYLVIVAPSRALLGSSFDVSVLNHYGDPVSGAEVGLAIGDDQDIVLTNDVGIAEIAPSSAGSCLLTASHVDYDGASATVEIIDPTSYPDEFLPVVKSFALLEEVISESKDVEGVVVVENAGAVSGTFGVSISIDSSPRIVLSVPLGPAEIRSVSFAISGIGVGTHTIQVGTYSHELAVEPWFADEPDLVQLALRYSGAGVLSSGTAIPIYQAAKISEGNVAVALFSIGAISALLASLAISAAFAKEIMEGRRTLGILRTIGASRAHIRGIVLPQALLNGFIGAVAGVAAGLVVTMWLTSTGVFTAFGHALAFEPDAPLLILVALGAAVISVSSSLASAEMAARESPISSIKGLEEGASVGEEVDLEALLSEE